MTLHPTYIEAEHEIRYNRLKAEATIHQLVFPQKREVAIRTAIVVPLGDLLITVGLKLAGHQAAT